MLKNTIIVNIKYWCKKHYTENKWILKLCSRQRWSTRTGCVSVCTRWGRMKVQPHRQHKRHRLLGRIRLVWHLQTFFLSARQFKIRLLTHLQNTWILDLVKLNILEKEPFHKQYRHMEWNIPLKSLQVTWQLHSSHEKKKNMPAKQKPNAAYKQSRYSLVLQTKNKWMN